MKVIEKSITQKDRFYFERDQAGLKLIKSFKNECSQIKIVVISILKPRNFDNWSEKLAFERRMLDRRCETEAQKLMQRPIQL